MNDLPLIARRALTCLDLTNLDELCTSADIEALCARAQAPEGPVAAVCIWPRHVSHARSLLDGSGVRVATVANFPSGAEVQATMLDIVRRAIDDGADEIDYVVPYRKLMAGVRGAVERETWRVKRACGPIPVKAILETGELRDRRHIERACEEALAGGADFLKTSTGKTPVSATPGAAQILLEAIRDSGRKVGFKPSGGIRSPHDASIYLDMCSGIMGPDWVSPATFRIGASSVLDSLLETIRGAEHVTPAS